MKLGAFFDGDGTIFDSNKVRNEFFTYLCFRYGKACPKEQIAEMQGKGLTIPEVYPRIGFPWQENRKMIWEEFLEFFDKKTPKIFPGLMAQLEKFAGNPTFEMAYISANDKNHIERLLIKSGIRNLFSVVTAVNFEKGETKKDALLSAAETLGLNPNRCFYAGDFPQDMEDAKTAGLLPIAIGYGGFCSAGMMRATVPNEQFVETPDRLYEIIMRNLRV